MIVYNPTDGLTLQGAFEYRPRECFLMTKLGDPVHPAVMAVRDEVTRICNAHDYGVIDANARVTGRDFLVKIWRLVAETPLSIGVIHEHIPVETRANIYYEMGIAQALGKETLIIKCPNSDVPSDFVRTEYIKFNDQFEGRFGSFLEGLMTQANMYETIADQLERNPVLALDYLKRAYLISGDLGLKEKARELVEEAGFNDRAKDSVEHLSAAFAQI